ncbi:MAG: hypothetical protein K8F52_00330 [Candidatus Scalindua rubra]|nr:hypothetical protein [Candidatus Scalindua rubra]TWU32114.1 hypothetical protein S225a_18780 [Candidatus Brocadiaceae bacterium S225]
MSAGNVSALPVMMRFKVVTPAPANWRAGSHCTPKKKISLVIYSVFTKYQTSSAIIAASYDNIFLIIVKY